MLFLRVRSALTSGRITSRAYSPTMRATTTAKVMTTMITASPYVLHLLEHLGGQMNARRREALAALGSNAGRAEAPAHLFVGRHAGALEQEQILERDDVAFHPGQ